MIFLVSEKHPTMSASYMKEPRLLLCTDMDRTVIPNGAQAEHKHAHDVFSRFCNLSNVTLAYVTGRHQELIRQAINDYDLPRPDYTISDVGTVIYHIKEQQWNVMDAWEEEIDDDWNGYSHQQLRTILSDMPVLQLQERSKQNTHKLSYYVLLNVETDDLLSEIKRRLDVHAVKASLVWSIDEERSIGLLDVLPRSASKLHAIDFLRERLGYAMDEVVFAGDSGNDLSVLVSAIPSVLVANAADEVRQAALTETKMNGNHDALYLASGISTNMNGNYSAGVLEGIYHFAPAFRRYLKQSGFCYE